MEEKMVLVAGKRKRSVAKVRVVKGNGKVLFNETDIENLRMFHILALREPIKIAEKILGKFDFDIVIRAMGGGKESQIQAARLGIAKAIVKITGNQELKEAFASYDRYMIVADDRRKEQRKPGDSKARAKRQKSYR
jgi:small subunit ribosomal protein S9